MRVHICNPRAQEAEAGGLHQVGDQPELDYTENSRPSRGTLWDIVSNKQNSAKNAEPVGSVSRNSDS